MKIIQLVLLNYFVKTAGNLCIYHFQHTCIILFLRIIESHSIITNICFITMHLTMIHMYEFVSHHITYNVNGSAHIYPYICEHVVFVILCLIIFALDVHTLLEYHNTTSFNFGTAIFSIHFNNIVNCFIKFLMYADIR